MSTPPRCMWARDNSPMNITYTKPLVVLAALLALGGCVVAPSPYYEPAPAYGAVQVAPPPPRYEVVGVAPAPGYVWIAGYWNWGGVRYEWVPGRWSAPRPGYVWLPHRWEHEGDHWRQRGGRWENEGRDRGDRDHDRDRYRH